MNCNAQTHAEIKACPVRWASEIQPIGKMDDGDGGVIVLGNCRCGSTLARQMTTTNEGGAQ